jgi:hypothetical protein
MSNPIPIPPWSWGGAMLLFSGKKIPGARGLSEGTLTADSIGELLALGGFIIFLVNSWGRSRQRQTGQPAGGHWALWLRWGDFAAFGLILAGLLLMWSQK